VSAQAQRSLVIFTTVVLIGYGGIYTAKQGSFSDESPTRKALKTADGLVHHSVVLEVAV